MINLQNISVKYGDFYALKNINLEIKKGEHSVIFGANGSGKSTLLKLFSGDLYPLFDKNSKCDIFADEFAQKSIFDLRTKIGLVTNDMFLQLLFLAKEESAFNLILSSFSGKFGMMYVENVTKAQKNITQDLMQDLGIWHLKDKNLSQLSTGETKKVLLARALVHKPQALILDEASNGLDLVARHDFLSLIQRLSKDLTIIFVSHNTEEILGFFKKIFLLKKAQIYKSGSIKNVLTSENLSHIFDKNISLTFSNQTYYASLI